MYVYNVLMSDNSVVEVYADSPEVAERDAERNSDNPNVYSVIAESV